MGKGELLGKDLFLFGDAAPGGVMLWIRDAAGAGAVGVPCHIDHLLEVLRGITYHVAAPGVECALRPGDETVDIELERPGNHRIGWSIPQTVFRTAVSRFANEAVARGEDHPFLS